MASTPGSWFQAQFKQYYERMFFHHFNYRTCRLENAPGEQKSSRPNIKQLHDILNPLPFYVRRQVRRNNLGD
jgi:hypothetical protein